MQIGLSQILREHAIAVQIGPECMQQAFQRVQFAGLVKDLAEDDLCAQVVMDVGKLYLIQLLLCLAGTPGIVVQFSKVVVKGIVAEFGFQQTGIVADELFCPRIFF